MEELRLEDEKLYIAITLTIVMLAAVLVIVRCISLGLDIRMASARTTWAISNPFDVKRNSGQSEPF